MWLQFMKYSETKWMGRKDIEDIIDVLSLEDGDKVEVCYCDTGGCVVWSFPAIAITVNKKMFLEDDYDDVSRNRRNNPNNKPAKEWVDGCYTFLRKR